MGMVATAQQNQNCCLDLGECKKHYPQPYWSCESAFFSRRKTPAGVHSLEVVVSNKKSSSPYGRWWARVEMRARVVRIVSVVDGAQVQ